MARRQKDLNRLHDPELARLLQELDQARSALLVLEQKGKAAAAEIAQATDKMERAESAVALRSATFRDDERASAVALDDVRRSLPKDSVLVSYVHFGRSSVEKVDSKSGKVSAYAAIVFHPDTGSLRVFDLGDGAAIDAWIESARKTVDIETQSGAVGGRRNERAYREAAGALRAQVWDPLKPDLAGAKLLLVVPDGQLNLIPFAAFPDGDGYWLDHGPVIHTLSSERDLIPSDDVEQKSGLVAIGNPEFDRHVNTAAGQQAALEPDKTRSADLSCDAFNRVQFHPLPESELEVQDIAAQWQAANSSGKTEELLGANATRESFLREAVRGRVLHVATHAFLLSQSCGDGNPLLQSGLVFAGANSSRESSILTAQQIASMDLSGVSWAVLSACNTGAGEVHDGEGVLGLQRAFRVAGARSVIMTLWPVDDAMSRRYMHELYAQRFGQGATTANAIWNASQKLLADRRAAGLSTHPWYWAGFVGSGSWK
jgi:CHAT domain-containing protein